MEKMWDEKKKKKHFTKQNDLGISFLVSCSELETSKREGFIVQMNDKRVIR